MTKTFSKNLIATFQAQLQSSPLSPTDQQLVMRFINEASDSALAVKTSPPTRSRARSNYQLWKSDEAVKAQFRTNHPGLKGSDTNIEMGKIWKAMSEQEKEPWSKQSREEKVEFGASSDDAKGSRVRKRSRTAYQCYKKDPAVIQAIRQVNPNLDQKAFNAIIKEQFNCLSLDEKAPYESAASRDKDLVDKLTQSNASTVASSDSEGTSDETIASEVVTSEVATKRKPSPYQKWKKDPDTKVQFQESHPGLDKSQLLAIMKAKWDTLTVTERAPWN